LECLCLRKRTLDLGIGSAAAFLLSASLSFHLVIEDPVGDHAGYACPIQRHHGSGDAHNGHGCHRVGIGSLNIIDRSNGT
jgi:hypothetical protein